MTGQCVWYICTVQTVHTHSKGIYLLLCNCVQVTLQCQERGQLMAELWQSLQTLVSATLAACEAARLGLASDRARSEALQAAMPLVQDYYLRQALNALHMRSLYRAGFRCIEQYVSRR